MTKALMSHITKIAMLPGIGGISQAVAGELVARCADPTLTNDEFDALVAKAAAQGYELARV